MTPLPEARRTILVAAYEEDALFDLLRELKAAFGADDRVWLTAIRDEWRQGLLEAYRYGPKTPSGETTFVPVDLLSVHLGAIGTDYSDPIYLAATPATAPAIRSLPPPAPGDDLWITGFWGKPPEA